MRLLLSASHKEPSNRTLEVPLETSRQIAEFVLFLPLNLIPIIGTPFFLVLTGARAGPFHHYRYFKLRGLSKKEKKDEIRKRKWKYTWYVSWS